MRRVHTPVSRSSSIELAAIAARTDFSSRLPLRRFACSWARRLAELSTSANEIRGRRWFSSAFFAVFVLARFAMTPFPGTGIFKVSKQIKPEPSRNKSPPLTRRA
jgi:hypothetical protein